ncbi:hypothetical protein ACFLZO_01185, partial [Patescibacteria group bacterium]
VMYLSQDANSYLHANCDTSQNHTTRGEKDSQMKNPCKCTGLSSVVSQLDMSDPPLTGILILVDILSPRRIFPPFSRRLMTWRIRLRTLLITATFLLFTTTPLLLFDYPGRWYFFFGHTTPP